MTDMNSREYYRHRAECERRIAARAIDPQIGAIHVAMAERYDALVDEMRPEEMPMMPAGGAWLSR